MKRTLQALTTTAFFFLLACSSDTDHPQSDTDTPPTDDALTVNDDDTLTDDSLLENDTDTVTGHPARWTVTEEPVPWDKNGEMSFYQWGTAKMDNATFMFWKDGDLYLVGLTNMANDWSTDAEAYLKIISSDDMVKTYSFGTDKIDWATSMVIDPQGRFLIVGATNGDMGKIWGKEGKLYTDAVLTTIDPATDEFSFLQWGNDKSSEPQIVYREDDGSLIVIGTTTGAFEGQTLHGKQDIFVSKIQDGTVTTTQFGPEAGASVLLGNRNIVKTDTHVYFPALVYNGALPGQTFAGGSSDGAVIALDRQTFAPTFYQVGTDNDEMIDALTEGADGKIYFVGATYGAFPDFTNLGNSDFFYGYLDGDQLVIANMDGTDQGDVAREPFFYNGALYHVGRTAGSCGSYYTDNYDDAILMVLDETFNIDKCLLFGAGSAIDDALHLSITPEGRVYISGMTYGALGGEYFGDDSGDSFDVFLMTAALSDIEFETPTLKTEK